MKTKQTRIVIIAALIFAAAISFWAVPSVQAACGDVETTIINCDNVSGKSGVEGTGVWSILLTAINILTAGIGIAALGGLVYGAILYTSAGGRPDQVKKATTIFTNVVIGVLSYAAMYAVLNFIIPGGVFA